MIDERTIVAAQAPAASYAETAPFHPDTAYPEYDGEVGREPNPAYAAVREAFRLAGLDEGRHGSADWNPLGELIAPGSAVVLKPNFVKEIHPRDPQGWRYVLTHGSVIRAVADYVWKAVGEHGSIVVADAPQTDSSFAEIVRILGVDEIRRHYLARGRNFELVDLRLEEWTNEGGVIVRRRTLPGDPRGGVAYDLGDASEFVGHGGAGHYYGAYYDTRELNAHHLDGKHEYLLAGSVMQADVVFSLPKLKTHKKAGVTCSMKNLIGANADKNWLPHHTMAGTPAADEHPAPGATHRLERTLAAAFRQLALHVPASAHVHRLARRVGLRVFGDTEEVVRSGNWWGNDTLWRMCLDLNKIVLYGNPDGTMRQPGPDGRRRHLVLVDAVLAGEGRGPVNPDPVEMGAVVFGTHPASVDAACAWLMGFDPDAIPIVRQAFRCRAYPLAEWEWRDVELVSDRAAWNGRLPEVGETLRFAPHFGWVGHVERAP